MNIFILFMLFLPTSFGKNVLLWSPPSKSHRVSMYPVAGALAERGHKVVLVSEAPEPEKVSPPPGVQEILIVLHNKSYNLWGPLFYRNDTTFDKIAWTVIYSVFWLEVPWKLFSGTCQDWLTNQREDFIAFGKQKWDLILVDPLFNPCGFGQTKLSPGIPFGLIHTTFLEALVSDQQALSWPVGTIAPEFPTVKFEASKFRSRLDSVKNYLSFYFVYQTRINVMIRNAIKATVGRVSLLDFYGESTASFVAYPDVLDWPYPTGSDVVNFGSACEFLVRKPLPKDLEAFVSDPKSKGTILFTFGSYIFWETAPKPVFDAVLTVLKALSDYRIIWRYTGPELQLPKHILVTKWAPQTDILLHPKTKVFWSHGGMKSVIETICAGVPAVYMPMFADQTRNGMAAVAKGFGELIDKMTITESEIATGTIRKVLESPEYKVNAVRMQDMFMDHLVPPPSKSAWLAEFLMKHGGMPAQFQRRGKRLNWVQFWNLDVFALLLLFLYLGLYCALHSIATGFRMLTKNKA